MKTPNTQNETQDQAERRRAFENYETRERIAKLREQAALARTYAAKPSLGSK